MSIPPKIVSVDSFGRAIQKDSILSAIESVNTDQILQNIDANSVLNAATSYLREDQTFDTSDTRSTDETVNRLTEPEIIKTDNGSSTFFGSGSLLYYPEEIGKQFDNISLDYGSKITNIMKFEVLPTKGGSLSTEVKSKAQRKLTAGLSKEEIFSFGRQLKKSGEKLFDFTTVNKEFLPEIWRFIKENVFLNLLDTSKESPVVATAVEYMTVAETSYTDRFDKDPITTIYLYVPNKLQYNQEIIYDESEQTSTKYVSDFVSGLIDSGYQGSPSEIASIVGAAVGSNIISGLVNTATSVLGGALSDVDLKSYIESRSRILPQPLIELLFKQVGRRKFNFEFTFYPKSMLEIRMVNAIIKSLRAYSLPERNAGNSRQLVMPPALRITHMTYSTEGKFIENLLLPKLKYCQIESINVDYTDSGNFVTFDQKNVQGIKSGSMPAGINLSISLVEMEILTVADVLGISTEELNSNKNIAPIANFIVGKQKYNHQRIVTNKIKEGGGY